MRVLHLISSSGMYGAEAVIMQLCAGMSSAQYGTGLLSVFSHAGQPVPELHTIATGAGVDSDLLMCQGQLDLGVPQALRERVEQSAVDVVHAHGYKADIYAHLAFRGRKTRPALVSTCHTWYDNDIAVRLYGMADRWVLRSFDKVVAVSAEVQRRLLKAGVAPHNLHLIRNGIALISPMERGRLGLPEAHGPTVRIGLVGRLAPEKGVDVFLQAVAHLPSSLNLEFVVAGEGPERAALEALQRQLDLQNPFAFLGGVRDMQTFYESLDVLVSASRQEGLPMALLEGMGAGLPVVATRVGEVPHVVVEGETGLLVAANDPSALATALNQLVRDPALRRQLGQGGRKRVEDAFSAARMTRDYVSVYNKAMADRAAAFSGRAA